MKSYPRILTIQDISCLGQCSMTVALPILSACGAETAVLPSAVLSTHSGGFTGFTFRDLTDDIPAIAAHWKKENILFDAFYTGYLGSRRQIAFVEEIFRELAKPGALRIVDPAMADDGRLYKGFDRDHAEAMRLLCAHADIILPNITEACMMTGCEWRDSFSPDEAAEIIDKMRSWYRGTVIMTGVADSENRLAVISATPEETVIYRHERIGGRCNGTGDIFASVFTGAVLKGISVHAAARIAADFTAECIRHTAAVPGHTYGACFEPLLGKLITMLNEAR